MHVIENTIYARLWLMLRWDCQVIQRQMVKTVERFWNNIRSYTWIVLIQRFGYLLKSHYRFNIGWFMVNNRRICSHPSMIVQRFTSTVKIICLYLYIWVVPTVTSWSRPAPLAPLACYWNILGTLQRELEQDNEIHLLRYGNVKDLQDKNHSIVSTWYESVEWFLLLVNGISLILVLNFQNRIVALEVDAIAYPR